jgi:hypothetical protein
MDWIKRNFDLIISLVVTLVLCSLLAWAAWSRSGKAAEFAADLNAQQEFLQKVRTAGIALNQDNIRIAKDNQEKAQAFLQEFQDQLVTKYGVRSETMSGLDVISYVNDQLYSMYTKLQEMNIVPGNNLGYFSFDNVAQRDTAVDQEVVPVILKQLKVVQELIRLAGNAYVTELNSVRRLAGTAVTEGEYYDSMPFQVVVIGKSSAVQRYINLIQSEEARYLFHIRYLALNSGDLNTLSSMATADGGAAGGMGGGMPSMGGAGGMPAMGGGGGMPMMGGTGGMPTMGGAGMMGTGMTSMTDTGYSSRTGREQRVLFRENPVRAEIVIDFIEFHK